MVTTIFQHIVTAIETGALVEKFTGTGVVVSVFDKAINIRLPNGLLISILKHPKTMTAMSVCCPDLFSDDLLSTLQANQTVIMDPVGLSVECVRMDTSNADTFEGLWTENSSHKTIPTTAVRMFERVLEFSGRTGGLAGLTRHGPSDGTGASLLLNHGRKIAAGVMKGKRPAAEELKKFIGLGPGFTPSGDDVICGFLLGDQMDSTHDRLIDMEGKQLLKNRLQTTNDGGKTLIWQAIQGRFPKYLLHVAKNCIKAKTAKEMLNIIQDASGYGHTSGIDALTGLLLYFKTAGNRAAFPIQHDNVSLSG